MEIRSTMPIKYIKVDSSTKEMGGQDLMRIRGIFFSLSAMICLIDLRKRSNRGLFSSGLLAYIFNSQRRRRTQKSALAPEGEFFCEGIYRRYYTSFRLLGLRLMIRA